MKWKANHLLKGLITRTRIIAVLMHVPFPVIECNIAGDFKWTDVTGNCRNITDLYQWKNVLGFQNVLNKRNNRSSKNNYCD